MYSSCDNKAMNVEGVNIVATFNVHNPATGNKFDLGDGKFFISLGRDSRVIVAPTTGGSVRTSVSRGKSIPLPPSLTVPPTVSTKVVAPASSILATLAPLSSTVSVVPSSVESTVPSRSASLLDTLAPLPTTASGYSISAQAPRPVAGPSLTGLPPWTVSSAAAVGTPGSSRHSMPPPHKVSPHAHVSVPSNSHCGAVQYISCGTARVSQKSHACQPLYMDARDTRSSGSTSVLSLNNQHEWNVDYDGPSRHSRGYSANEIHNLRNMPSLSSMVLSSGSGSISGSSLSSDSDSISHCSSAYDDMSLLDQVFPPTPAHHIRHESAGHSQLGHYSRQPPLFPSQTHYPAKQPSSLWNNIHTDDYPLSQSSLPLKHPRTYCDYDLRLPLSDHIPSSLPLSFYNAPF